MPEQVKAERSNRNFLDGRGNSCNALPDLRIEIEDMIAEDDKVTVRYRVRAAHFWDALGFAATHEAVDFIHDCLPQPDLN